MTKETATTVPLSHTAIGKDLLTHAQSLRQTTLCTLFNDPQRATRFRAEGAGLVLDYSRNLVTDHTLRLLFELAQERFFPLRREGLFSGAQVNVSEQRPALHTALRAPVSSKPLVDGRSISPEVHAVLDQMEDFVESLWAGSVRGATGKPIRNVVNIGIGGSYLGPEMAYQALRRFRNPAIAVRFLANIDGAAFDTATEGLDPAETLFLVCSKTFTTLETLQNAKKAQAWVRHSLDNEDVSAHFVGITSNANAAREFGIPSDRVFRFWEWVGGRYSVDSAVGLSLMASIGSQHFRDFLHGFCAMDDHFQTASPTENLPFLHGMISIWNNNYLGASTLAILPYAHDLRRFPAYLQQLFMESNGKRVDQQGSPVDWDTCPIVWGEPGTDGQHSFYQLLHQGTRKVACDFIGFLQPLSDDHQHHDILMASLFAQCEALAFGKDAESLAAEGVPSAQIPHRVCPGNRPSTLLLAKALTPNTLGTLIALYEQSVFVQGMIWDIDSFDQWGVELGKHLAQRLLSEIAERKVERNRHDSATVMDLDLYLGQRQ
ncbi:MAG: glucose-6-phosphate isomerase [Acidobacteriaceae bacterium]